MADLRPGADRRGGRGQIILIGAFALAVVFVALALVTNAAIYTENLATRSESAETANAHAFHRATATMASDSFRYAHDAHSGDHEALNRSVRDSVEVYYDATRRQQAAHGQITNVSVTRTNPGVNVTNTDGTFGSDGGLDDWTVATGVRGFHTFRLDVEGWSGPDSEELRVVADDAETWYVNVSHDGSSYTVGVNDSGTYSECEPSIAGDFTVDFAAGTVAGDDCAALDLKGASGPYDLRFENGSVASGDYTMVVDGAAGSEVTDAQGTEILYSMEVDLVYWSPDLRYRSTIRVGPGERRG
ncbi:DUF7261 family protein [Halosimplex pelagicum]|uniref:Uncharacterized protein n=1 Tax=Halosimplex pelagicum TaxID=869886 RepID=A0A7D5TAJ1_9EURY|nr:hypothetical protein [Halosimplex pelagicum]QLH82790.1 hypothetical protein HZS54_14670 [Halosimplex pelagicum]